MSGLTPTAIPYLTHVWPVVTGCSPAGDGCTHCYGARLAATRLCKQPRYKGLALKLPPYLDCSGVIRPAYSWTGEVRFHPDLLNAPLRARKPRVIGVCFTSDLFHPKVSDNEMHAVFSVMARAPQHTFVVLTKRTKRMCEFLTYQIDSGETWREGCTRVPLPNLVLGTSVWDQASADRNIPHLLDAPAACRVVSVEPMIGPVDLSRYVGAREFFPHEQNYSDSHAMVVTHGALHGVFLGGETGPGARPMRPEWALGVWRQCKAAGAPFYWKGWGSFNKAHWHPPAEHDYYAMEQTHELPEVMRP